MASSRIVQAIKDFAARVNEDGVGEALTTMAPRLFMGPQIGC